MTEDTKTEDTKTKRKTKAESSTVPMTRELQPGESGPTTADVHKDEVENWQRNGWTKA